MGEERERKRETQTATKSQPMDWEEIVANDVTDKSLISKIYKQLRQQQQQQKLPQLGRRPK